MSPRPWGRVRSASRASRRWWARPGRSRARDPRNAGGSRLRAPNQYFLRSASRESCGCWRETAHLGSSLPMQVLPLSENEAIGLSDRAWEVIDPESLHEADERCWVDELARQLVGQPPVASIEELRTRLAAVCSAVGPAMDSVPPRAIRAPDDVHRRASRAPPSAGGPPGRCPQGGFTPRRDR